MQAAVDKASEDAAAAVAAGATAEADGDQAAAEDVEMQGAETADEAPATPGDPSLVEGAAAASGAGDAAGGPAESTVAEAEIEVCRSTLLQCMYGLCVDLNATRSAHVAQMVILRCARSATYSRARQDSIVKPSAVMFVFILLRTREAHSPAHVSRLCLQKPRMQAHAC